MALLNSYQQWLVNQHYSDVTIKNYLADANRYLNFLNSNSKQSLPSSQIFNQQSLSSYISSLTNNPNQKRYLSSLNLLCRFAADQNLIAKNSLQQILDHKIDLDELVKLYQTEMVNKNTPQATIKNYINDLNQYISWLETQVDSQ